ncbi:hypothetical protein D9758_001163 [Tetrapyrgos nigripes]|uniref:Carboxylesterase type B domain-containing protein n=1 Tax=Tetrapyrgos nigripes TaxID=182062 RepID=A0A8H5GRS3_9AGAR|nr:hypothetical protein D9758_001163 [Tetrapyrgos nigripes]
MTEDRHLHDELAANSARVIAETKFGPIKGGRAANNCAVWLEIPYALPPGRFEDPKPLPDNFRYEDQEYIKESSYCAQPTNDGQASSRAVDNNLKPTSREWNEHRYTVPGQSGAREANRESFGSPHGLKGQGQYVSAEREEVRVNIGYRLSAFGFLASDQPKINGNFGFKDQWLALKWCSENIDRFGGLSKFPLALGNESMKSLAGDPENIQILGLSAGAHSVHQILHHVSRLPEGMRAPFKSAVLMSNAIVLKPKSPHELRPQFEALCRVLDLDPKDPNILDIMRDSSRVSASKITHVIETDKIGTEYGTFRGCLDDNWMAMDPDPMAWHTSGQFASNLLAKGVKSVVVGDLKDEWYLYSIAHPIPTPAGIKPNLERYYPEDMVDRMVKKYRTLPDNATEEASMRLFGEVLSDFQVHFPVRLLARDLHSVGYPILRYQVRWTPEQNRPKGYVTHATDSCLWHLRIPVLEPDQVPIAKSWLERIESEVQILEADGKPARPVTQVLTLKEDKKIEWCEDPEWEEKIRLLDVL